MSTESPEASTEVLSDEQRIAALEKSHKLDRIMLFGLAVMAAIVLASWITAGLMDLFGDDHSYVTPEQFETLQSKALSLEKQLTQLEQTLGEQQELLTTLQERKPDAAPATSDNRVLTQQVAKTLLSQELNYQESLTALKAGMRDLAGMISGSRSWLDDYHEALDKTLAESRARAKKLEQWASGKSTTP